MRLGGSGRLRPWTVVGGLAVALLVVFLLVEWAGIPLLVDPRSSLRTVSVAAAAVGVGLLVVDAVLPVPSSVVMVALGATFGVTGGILLSVAGSAGGFALGYALGRRSRRGPAAMDAGDVARGAALVRRWGALAIVASRPDRPATSTISAKLLAAGFSQTIVSPMRIITIVSANMKRRSGLRRSSDRFVEVVPRLIEIAPTTPIA